MRRTRFLGFLAMGVGVLLIVGAAVLPVSPAPQRFGPFRINIRSDNCGPAAYAAYRMDATDCGSAAQRRLIVTTGIGVLVIALGMALFAGGDQPHHSRVQVPLRPATRRAPLRSPGSRRYKPG